MFSRIDRSRAAIGPLRTFAGMFGVFGISACLLAAGCSGGEPASTPIEGDGSGLVELSTEGEAKSSGPELNAMTPGGKGPRGAAAAPTP